ncbi:ligase-associated DNA damage response exonuclease [Legionella dresdenensis]|uniref:Ligase-associated DNA damage response exonuclease n=1 Tax=Legionella dresdenensis TaxID=450200 RepID=A0ABV8CDK9_9GAMM
MEHPRTWLSIKNEGLYCEPGQFYIDPHSAVNAAIITHGHGDHARSGHNKVLATPATCSIMKSRYGEHCAVSFQSMNYQQAITINQVKVYLLPAGHILGSAQLVMEYQGTRVIVSGDYKRAPDPTCTPFMAENCDIFITEATFSLPIFRHPPIEAELAKLLNSIAIHPDRSHLVGAYALGKCQRLIKSLRLLGYEEPVYLHGALIKLCELYQQTGIDLGELKPASELDAKTSAGKLIICPPSALHDRWSRRFANPVIGNASGWMQIRARAKQKGIDLPLIISDHADWSELTQTILEVNPSEIWVTHGREEALVHYARQEGYRAQALNLLGYEEGED